MPPETVSEIEKLNLPGGAYPQAPPNISKLTCTTLFFVDEQTLEVLLQSSPPLTLQLSHLPPPWISENLCIAYMYNLRPTKCPTYIYIETGSCILFIRIEVAP